MALERRGSSDRLTPMRNPSEHFAATIDRAASRLAGVDDAAASNRAGDGWSAKQIVGHLIDSASNNHGRIVRAQGRDDLAFDGYDGDHWVDAQRYDEAAWKDLLDLWRAYNAHLARIVAAIPDEELDRPRTPHTLDRIAFRAVPADRPATLRYLVEDYVAHLESHVRQIVPDYEPVSE
jgi:hypothetical protein